MNYTTEQQAVLASFAKYVPESMPKSIVEKVFTLAWDYGHADGVDAVKNYFMDIIDVARR